VRVRDLLARAGLKPSARHLHGFGADTPPGKVPPFHRSWELEKVQQDALLAYEMNGKPLPPFHGAPARMVVPGWAGDHWMKWLTRLSPEPEPQHGFYMDVAYRYPQTPGAPGVPVRPEDMTPVTELFVKSLFTSVPARAQIGKPLTLRGLAFSGSPDISKVDVSDDDGVSWQPASLETRHDPYAWRRWSFRWTPTKPGTAILLARATDSRGSSQPRNHVWNPSGYLSNGWHSVTIQVTDDSSASTASTATTASNPPKLGTTIPALPDGDGKELALRSCTQCHSTEMLRQQHLTERQWTANLAKMKGWGAELNDEASARLLEYLNHHFGTANTSFRPVPTRPNPR
jgi:DMSO/TMAO reductase YedYZ molybdopterin-dependent catalytic subunit